MKKLFMFLAVAGLATFGVSCSSDDDSDDPVKVEGQLALKADKTEIRAGESVKFAVTLDGEEETAAELSVDGVKISSPHTFSKEGKYDVVAKKKGAKDSAAVKITVAKGDGETKTLVLEGDLLKVNVGDKVTFKVTDGKDVVVDIVITEVDSEVVVEGVWTAEKIGTFKFVATKEGYNKSNEFSVEVVDKTGPEVTPNSIVLGTKKFDLNIGILGVDKYLSGIDPNGNDEYTHRDYILDGKVYYVYTYQMFKGTDFDDDYDNAWEEDGIIYGVKVAVPQDENGVKTPENSDPTSWLFVDMYVVLDGEVAYETLLDDKVKVGYSAGEQRFSVVAQGTFTSPETTDFESDFSGAIAKSIYLFVVDAPTTQNATNLKEVRGSVRGSKNLKMFKK